MSRIDFDLLIPQELSFEQALVKAKQELSTKKLHLRGWQLHHDPQYYFRAVSGGWEFRTEAALAAAWPSIALCESPIEVLFYEQILGQDLFDYKLHLQLPLSDGRFRVDFFFAHKYKAIRSLCVEVDGHAFHERTKAQAARDKQRDRFLTKSGVDVLRFTGSEVFNAPVDCATEALNYLRKLAHG